MLPFISKKSNIKLKILAWYQIIGGIAGLLITIWLLARTGQINGLILLILLFASGLYVFSIYCGRLLLTINIFWVLSYPLLTKQCKYSNLLC